MSDGIPDFYRKNCGCCHISHMGAHDGTGLMRLPDWRTVPDPLHVSVRGAAARAPARGRRA